MKNTLYQARLYVFSSRVFGAVNVIGLTLALGCTMLLAMYVHREATTDRWLDPDRRIYALTAYDNDNVLNPRLIETSRETDAVIDITAQPEVSACTAAVKTEGSATVHRYPFNVTVLRADSMFFRLLDWPLAAGDRNTLLSRPDDAAVSADFARRAFGDSDPLGETVEFDGKTYTVAAVVADCRRNTSIRFDVAVPYAGYENSGRGRAGCTFLSIDTPEQAASLAAKIDRDIDFGTHTKHLSIVPLRKLYFAPIGTWNLCSASGDAAHIRTLAAAALAVLVVGIFNFLNLYSVMLRRRGREMGLKKVFGASGANMYMQFAAECVYVFAAASLLALAAVEYLRPAMGRWFGMTVTHYWPFVGAVLLFTIFVLPPLVAVVPYVRYRRSVPVDSLRNIGTVARSSLGRYLFVALQYVVSLVFITVALYFVRQMHWLLSEDLGYETETVLLASPVDALPASQRDDWSYCQWLLSADGQQRAEADLSYQRTAAVLDSSPVIEAWGMGYIDIVFEWEIRPTGVEEYTPFVFDIVPAGFDRLYDLRLTEGRFFREDEGQYDNKIVLTESLRRRLGLGSIEGVTVELPSALNVKVDADGNEVFDKVYEVVGVIEDIRLGDLTEHDQPAALIADWPEMRRTQQLAVRYAAGRREEAVAVLEKLYDDLDVQLEVRDMNDVIADRYAKNRRIALVYSLFALVAVIVSALGLYGQVVYDLRRRRREIAIRKVNGASVRRTVGTVLRVYYAIFVCSLVAAVPVSWWIIDRYTEEFVRRAPVSWWLFALAAVLAVLLSLPTVALRAFSAARENPIDAIKSE